MNLGKSTWIVIVIGAFVASGSAFADASTQSEQAVRQGGRASGHASGSAAHAIAASGQATSAIAAIPLASGGVVSAASGAGSTAVAKDSARAANQPLEIADETITAMPPPDQALKNQANKPLNGI